jgi:hypothetical protein
MATVQNLIDLLTEIEDKSQTIVFQYYLADMFLVDDANGDDVEPSQELFTQAAELVDRSLWNGVWEDLAAEVANLHNYEQAVASESKTKTCRCTDCKCGSKNEAAGK